jgi:hypothetical protein
MSNENDSLVDKDGVVHEKGWDGQYHPKQGLFGSERDTNWTGQANVERDWLGNPKEERDWLGRPTQSAGGETLYRRSGSGSGGSSSTSGGEALLYVILAVAMLAVGLIGIAIAATPILAPIFLTTTENARKNGNMAEFKKWQSWGVLASLAAILVVLGIAGMIALGFFSGIARFAQNTDSSIILDGFIYLLAIAVGLITFVLSFVTGISPTAVVYLRNKEKQLRILGKELTATRIRRLNWAIGIIAIGTVAVTVIGIVGMIIIAIVTSWFSS